MKLALPLRLAAFALVVAGSAAGCNATESPALLTDPHEIVTAAANHTTALSTVHVQIDLQATEGNAAAARQMQILLEADIDTRGHQAAGRAQMTGDGADAERSEFIVVNGTTFSRANPQPKWTARSGAGEHLPTNVEYVQLLEGAVNGGNAVLTLREPIQCGSGTCYQVTANLNPAATWRLLLAHLIGGEQGEVEAPPPGLVPGPAVVELYIDQATRAWMGFTASFTIAESTIGATATFSNHDLPIVIAAPALGLVENPGDIVVP